MTKTRQLTQIALLITFALVIHTIESYIPVPVPIPGAKLGLANVISLLTLVLLGVVPAFFVAIVRTVLGSMFAGNFLGIGFILSFFGAIISTFVMAAGISLWQRGKISLVAISMMGAVAHNTTQVTIASLVIRNLNLIRLYLPFLLVLAVPTGIFTGLVVTYTQKALTQVAPGFRRN